MVVDKLLDLDKKWFKIRITKKKKKEKYIKIPGSRPKFRKFSKFSRKLNMFKYTGLKNIRN